MRFKLPNRLHYGIVKTPENAKLEIHVKPYTRISACGLDCDQCDIFLLPNDPSAQIRLLPWFREMKWLAENEGIEVVIEKRMYCKGCNVDRDIFWSDGCEIAACCKTTHGLENCSQCKEFPCNKLLKWAEQGGKYEQAFLYLQTLSASS